MHRMQAYRAVAETRRRELASRFGFGLFLAFGAWVLVGLKEAELWMAAFVLTQLADAAVGDRLADPESTPIWRRIYSATMLISAVTFSSLAALTWFFGGPTGEIFALLMLAGALLNSTIIGRHSPRHAPQVWFTHATFLMGLPLLGGALSPEADFWRMAFVSLGCGVYIGHLLLAVRRINSEQDERARATHVLQETQSALAAFVATVPASVVVTDAEMRILDASPEWLRSFGTSRDEARGRPVYDLSPNYFEPFRSTYERCLAGERIQASKVRSPQPDGSVRWLRVELTPWRDAEGAIGGIIAAALDVTDMVEALERTERSQQRLKLAVEIADLHVWECDYLRQTVETDGAADTFFDYEVEPAAFLKDTNFTIDPRDRAQIADEWEAAVLADRPFRPEYRVNRRDGKEVWATCTVKLVRNERGRPIRMIGAMQNITERKAVERELLRAKEEAEAANRAKSTFLATMSHEIRTPLNGVIGMAQAMEADELSDAQRERLSVVRRSGETLLAILNDVLDLSKIEAGKLELEVGEFDLTDLVVGAHAAFAAVAERKGVAFKLHVAPEAPGRYRSDSTRIRQIIYNLLSNALKFTEEGEVMLAVARSGESLEIEVADTGAGIPPATLKRLFNKFEQADASTTRRYGGTGLGLAICRELATLLGGTITAESKVGEGSRFQLRVPLQRVGDEGAERPAAPPSAPAPTAEPEPSASEFRVLAAEDNQVNQLVLQTLLRQFGVEPVMVANGAEALAAWREADWDLILMDVQMPVLDGPGATQAIRAEERASGRPRTRIVALTANAMAHQVDGYLAAGMDGIIAKPIDARRLYEALAAHEEAA